MCFPIAAVTLAGAIAGPGAIGAAAVGSSFLVAGGTAIGVSSGFASAFSFLTSPGFSLFTRVAGFGIQMAGSAQQNAYQRARADYDQAQLRNRQIVAQQNIDARQLRLQVELGIIGDRGAEARGLAVTEAAGRGVLVESGSEADRTEQLAGDIAFQKELAKHRVSLQDREDRIVASGLGADSALLDFDVAQSERASVFSNVGGALELAKGFSKFRFNTDGELAFRT